MKLPLQSTRPTLDGGFPRSRLRKPTVKSGTATKLRHHSALRLNVNRVLDLRGEGGASACCRRRCLCENLQGDMANLLLQWRAAWASLTSQQRRETLMAHVRRNITVDSDIHNRDGPLTSRPKYSLRYSFLSCLWCKSSWHMATGIGVGCVQDTVLRVLNNETRYARHNHQREAWVQDQMHGCLLELIQFCQDRMPLRRLDKDDIIMPMHHPIELFRMLWTWWKKNKVVLLKEPKYNTFRTVMSRSAFEKVRFHRAVDMGRCAICAWLQWKCLTCSDEERPHWNQVAAEHQLLQLEQKYVYAQDRVAAAKSFPHSTVLYLAMDASSGLDACLPHQASQDLEGPSKALKNMTTPAMKMMNCLIHGDSRAHVVLSPASVRSVPQQQQPHHARNSNNAGCGDDLILWCPPLDPLANGRIPIANMCCVASAMCCGVDLILGCQLLEPLANGRIPSANMCCVASAMCCGVDLILGCPHLDPLANERIIYYML